MYKYIPHAFLYALIGVIMVVIIIGRAYDQATRYSMRCLPNDPTICVYTP
jgi:hypothetical protein